MPEAEGTTPVSRRRDDPRLFLDPLGYLQTEFYRQRIACNTLEALATSGTGGDARADAERLLRYLMDELPMHLADEEESLFPLLAQRALAEDGLDDILEPLHDERARNAHKASQIADTLRQVAAGAVPPGALRAEAGDFADRLRRHLARETDVILPLARRRLTAADLVALGKAMALRRGVSYPG